MIPSFTGGGIFIWTHRKNGYSDLVESVELLVDAYLLSAETITAELSWSFSATPTATLTQTFTIDVVDCLAYLENKTLTPDTLTVPKGAGA